MSTKTTAKKATSTRRTATKKATTTAKPKATAKPEPKVDGQHRKAVLDRMTELGYTGPTSYTATMLRDTILPWLEAGAPAGDESIPAGVRFAVHPDLRPAKQAKARRLSKGYLAALADVLAVLDAGEDVREWITPRLANGEDVA